MEFPKDHQGSAKKLEVSNPLDAAELRNDAEGITHPNLHRRVDAKEPELDANELFPRSYKFAVASKYSYRTTQIHLHDENSERSELP